MGVAEGSTIFMNLRYYAQVHVPDIRRKGAEGRERAFLFWFCTLAHEFAHNEHAGHNTDHESAMEELIARFMPAAVDAAREWAQSG
jgi:hypothetical protein